MQTMKRVVIVAKGHLSDMVVSQIRSRDMIVGVDGAAYWLIQHGITLDVAIGDFDSVTKEQLTRIKQQSPSVLQFPTKKDATDLELAIDHAITLHPQEVVILGSDGTRLDHSFVAIQLLEKFVKYKIIAIIRNEKNECVLCNSTCVLTKNDTYRYFSLLPMTDEISVSISGCAYPLTHTTICRGVSLGISNEIVSEIAEIVVHNGIALIIRSCD
jgi:thiamine pyrophosphokinase